MTEPTSESDPLRELLSAIVGKVSVDHDRAHMSAEAKLQAIYAMLDTMSGDQLLSLVEVLRLDEFGRVYIRGQAASILRLIHKIDPETGDDLLVH